MPQPYDLHFNDRFRMRLERRIVRWLTPSRWKCSQDPRPDMADVRAHAAWLGRRGEDYAQWWLRRHKGFVVLERNYRHGHQELDIIARDGIVVVFAEVRTVSSDFLQAPSATITPTKRENLHRAAKAWREARRYRGHWRMDIVGIVWPDPEIEPRRIDHWVKCF